jgi:hypothetical protein
MPRAMRNLVASLLLALLLASGTGLPTLSQAVTPGAPPQPVTDAVAASAPPTMPAQIVVGAYINDIQELDFKTNSYAVDLYVWFRWRGSDLEPNKTMEFMNRYAPEDHVRDNLYEQPKVMPDGSLYAIIRNQGRFSTKFPLEQYPFDTQYLSVVMEDTIAGANRQVYVPDPHSSVAVILTSRSRASRSERRRCVSWRGPIRPISAIWPSRRPRLIRA